MGTKNFRGVDTYTAALERIELAYKLFDTMSVGFSGGKDSTCVLNLTLEVARHLNKLPVNVYFWDEEAIPYETEDYVRRTYNSDEVQMDWYCVPVKHRNACSTKEPFWYPWALEDKDKWVRDLPPEAITRIENYNSDDIKSRLSIPELDGLSRPSKKYGTVGRLMGIRADESLSRYLQVGSKDAAKREYNFIIPFSDKGASGGKVLPVYDWTVFDVWQAPLKYDWDYNHSYSLEEMAGIPPASQRCAPPFGEEPMQKLWRFPLCYPDVWEKMQDRVHGVRTAARYSTTELYAFNKTTKKPEDMAWEEWVLLQVQKHPKDLQMLILTDVRRWISSHFKKTNDPILPTAIHPLTGLNWDMIVKIAIRGNTKGRRMPQSITPEKDPEEFDKRKKAYEKELEIESADK
jgi:predicted phosphoadenosine phosphosulfate sulfurtransferase